MWGWGSQGIPSTAEPPPWGSSWKGLRLGVGRLGDLSGPTSPLKSFTAASSQPLPSIHIASRYHGVYFPTGVMGSWPQGQTPAWSSSAAPRGREAGSRQGSAGPAQPVVQAAPRSCSALFPPGCFGNQSHWCESVSPPGPGPVLGHLEEAGFPRRRMRC